MRTSTLPPPASPVDRGRWSVAPAWLSAWLLISGVAAPAPAADTGRFPSDVQPFLKQHCIRCHGPGKAEGDLTLHKLSGDLAAEAKVWKSVLERLDAGDMPPEDQPRPPAAAIKAVSAWLRDGLKLPAPAARPPEDPNHGNRIAHDLLFGKPAADPAGATPARVWRLSPDGYLGLVREVHRGRTPAIVQPFTLTSERGIRDFAGLYSIDEPSTEILLRNAEAIVAAQSAHAIKDGRLQGFNDTVREFVALMDPKAVPDRRQLEAAVQMQFRMAIGRQADAGELGRFVALYEKCAADGDRPAAVRTMLAAVLLRTDALYRSELGAGKADGASRRMLAPEEIARAVSLALGDRRETGLMQAAAKGQLATRDQVAAHVRRILDDPKVEKPGLLGFFREYFEYHKAVDVFKDKPKDIYHDPEVLVRDTDRLVLHVLAADKDVLATLLTTPTSYVNYGTKKNKKTRMDDPVPARVLNPNNDKGVRGVEAVYGLDAWPDPQPTELPRDTRLGILMQPSWLVAWSTNFENDPVRRGRWIRERLLGGNVPELPIGVAAQVPDEPHRTFRDRLQVTRAEQCWKCHRRMDDLGLPFENFDHYGRFRTAEKVVDPEATARNVDKKGKPLGPVLRDAPLDTTGRIAESGDPALDGPVKDPREFVRKLAGSARVRQVFVRHAFRYFLGRNETLSDARTLQAADRAYVESGGSFKTLVVSLLTSDAFLYRTATATAHPASGDRP